MQYNNNKHNNNYDNNDSSPLYPTIIAVRITKHHKSGTFPIIFITVITKFFH